jgi:hypothetical protein
MVLGLFLFQECFQLGFQVREEHDGALMGEMIIILHQEYSILIGTEGGVRFEYGHAIEYTAKPFLLDSGY